MAAKELNTTTASFTENREGGLMICGINWGGSEDETPNDGDNLKKERKSFFSDADVNNWPYRNRLLRWFELFGHPLRTTEDLSNQFERSIIQTNWLSSQSKNMAGKSIRAECISEWDNFAWHVQTIKPKIIVFLSVSLLDTLNSSACVENAKLILGDSEKAIYYKKTVPDNGKALKRFRVGVQNFKRTTIIALPHPTGSKGLSHKYIQAFKPEIYPILQKYKNERGFNNGVNPV